MPRASDRAIRLGADDEEVWELPVTCCSSSVQRVLTPRASDRTIRLGAYDEEDWELNMSVAGESANGKATQPIQSIVTSASKGMQMASRATQHAVRVSSNSDRMRMVSRAPKHAVRVSSNDDDPWEVSEVADADEDTLQSAPVSNLFTMPPRICCSYAIAGALIIVGAYMTTVGILQALQVLPSGAAFWFPQVASPVPPMASPPSPLLLPLPPLNESSYLPSHEPSPSPQTLPPPTPPPSPQTLPPPPPPPSQQPLAPPPQPILPPPPLPVPSAAPPPLLHRRGPPRFTDRISPATCNTLFNDGRSLLRKMWGIEARKQQKSNDDRACFDVQRDDWDVVVDPQIYFDEVERGANCESVDWYAGSSYTDNHGYVGDDEAFALLGFDRQIEEYCYALAGDRGPEECDRASAHVLQLMSPRTWNICRNVEWQICAAKGLLSHQQRAGKIRFAFQPNDLFLSGRHESHQFGVCGGLHADNCDSDDDPGFGNDDVFFLEVCVYSQVCRNGAELFRLDDYEEFVCDFSNSSWHTMRDLLLEGPENGNLDYGLAVPDDDD